MQWDKETEAVFHNWFQMPQKAWENWWDVVAGSTQNGHATNGNGKSPYGTFPNLPANYEMMFNLWNQSMKQWQGYMAQAFGAFSPESADNARLAMEQFLAGQAHAQQLMKMMTDAWQTIVTNASSPAEWQDGLNIYMEQMRAQMADVSDGARLMENSTKLWQLYGQEMQKFSQPWLQNWTQMSTQMGMVSGPRMQFHPMVDMMNMAWDSYNQTLGRMVNMPTIGLNREFNEKVNRAFVTWQENQRINLEYQAVLGDVMLSSFEAFMQELLEKAKAGEAIDSQNKLLSLWVEVADEEFLALFHSERYAAIQSKYVNSSMALRQQQRELVEIVLRMNDLPTQSDMDEAHKNIFELRKEVKALKKMVHEFSSRLDAEPSKETKPAPATKKSTARSRTTKTNKAKASSSAKSKSTRSSRAKAAGQEK